MRMWALNAPESRRVEFAPVHPILSGRQPRAAMRSLLQGPRNRAVEERIVFAPRPQPGDLRAASSGLGLGPSGDVITTSANGCFLLDVLVSLICSCFKSNHESNNIVRE